MRIRARTYIRGRLASVQRACGPDDDIKNSTLKSRRSDLQMLPQCTGKTRYLLSCASGLATDTILSTASCRRRLNEISFPNCRNVLKVARERRLQELIPLWSHTSPLNDATQVRFGENPANVTRQATRNVSCMLGSANCVCSPIPRSRHQALVRIGHPSTCC